MNKKIVKVLEELCEEVSVDKGRVNCVYKAGKEVINQSFVGKNRYILALKEVLKNQ